MKHVRCHMALPCTHNHTPPPHTPICHQAHLTHNQQQQLTIPGSHYEIYITGKLYNAPASLHLSPPLLLSSSHPLLLSSLPKTELKNAGSA